MNKFGIALAADSAVTLRDGHKIYHHAQKLFPLRPDLPVAIMIYGSAELMATPWEIVITAFIRHLGDQKFDKLEQYVDEFFRFIETSNTLFPASLQKDWFKYSVGSYWKDQYAKPLAKKLKERPTKKRGSAAPILARLVERDNADWQKYPVIEQLGPTYGANVIAEYGPVLDEMERHVFSRVKLTKEIRDGLRKSAQYMYARRWFHSHDRSGVVFGGMGEQEPFPVLKMYRVGSMAAGKLRQTKLKETQITHMHSAIVAPFAQSELIDMFYSGIDPGLEAKLDAILARSMSSKRIKNRATHARARIEKVQKAFQKGLREEIDRMKDPLMTAVEALPRHDLAKIAEVLVSLTAFRKKMSATQAETVGGAIDVAILSKGDGFVWVKRNGSNRGAENHR